jgi:dihydroxyacetone kinase-like predicted kinase
MVGYDPEGEPDEVVEDMREIAQDLRCAEVTWAMRDALIDGRVVKEGA